MVGLPGECVAVAGKGDAIIVRGDDSTRALLVDGIVDARDLITKGMGKYLRKVRGVPGSAILGDGTVAPLIDIPELLRAPRERFAASTAGSGAQEATDELANTVLIVDDSLSVRKSLALLVEDAGYVAKTAKDGLDAIEIMKSLQPRVVLTDLEMPNMNGLELTAHLRGIDATKRLPVIMITSRSQEKHKRQAESAGVSAYLTKPYGEHELLGHIRSAFEHRV